jgi:chemotaxis protein methyltransferase CheR
MSETMILPLLRPSTTVKMSDAVYRSLQEYIYGLTGIYFQDTKKYLLEGRLGKRLQALNIPDFETYLQKLKYGKGEELRFFYEAITINETFFFRNEPQFEAFEKALVPAIVGAGARPGNRKLRVWSAASSSGEEAYTLAMLFLERLKPRYPSLDIEIVGTDISQAVLETARRGVYRDYSVRNMPKSYLEKYFTVQDSRYIVHDNVRSLVRFENLNLYDRQRMKMMANFDIIFCCNVLIYFEGAAKRRVISHFFNNLCPGGYLYLGYSESLFGFNDDFRLVHFPGTTAYRKPERNQEAGAR